MKTTFLKSVLFLAVTAGTLTSCVNDDDYSIPQLDCTDTTVTANIPVSAVTGTATPKQYLQDDIIEAYVSSSDEGGNFFKTISFQTLPKDGPVKAFSVPVDASSTFINFTPGRKVFIKLKDLYTDVAHGGLRIGALFLDNSGTASVGRMPESQYRSALVRSCQIVEESELLQVVTIEQAMADNKYLNTLIEFENVQFADAALNKTYYDENNQIGGATNHMLVDASGKSIIFRTSSFANFAGKPVPGKSGRVRGVLTKFNNDYQFMARTERDVNLTNERFFVDTSAPALGGTDIQFLGSFVENFESYAAALREFPRYINDPIAGSRYWAVTAFGGNKYIQMTSFGGTPELNRSMFIVPVDMTAANTFSFQSKAGYSNGAALKVYYIMASDYTPGGPLNPESLTEITSSFTLSPGSSTGYPDNFTNSGNYSIPASLQGNGFFVFEYNGNGNGGVTTTIQIDNITVN
jgi:hypothetical protein